MKVSIAQIFNENEWLFASEGQFRSSSNTNSINASEIRKLEVRGSIYCVEYLGRKYCAAYQFGEFLHPLPIIGHVLKEFNGGLSPWEIAMWFHFPNGWIVDHATQDPKPIAPKDALNRREDVINAARNHKGTYVS